MPMPLNQFKTKYISIIKPRTIKNNPTDPKRCRGLYL